MINFLAGLRWLEEYSDYQLKKYKIVNDYDLRKETFEEDGNDGLKKYEVYKESEYEDIREIDPEMDAEIESLDEEYYVSSINYDLDSEDEILDWIDEGMPGI